MSEYDCRAGFGTHAHGRESSADAADSSFDLSVFAKDSLRMLLRLFWLPLLLAVVQMEDSENAIKRYSLLVQRYTESELSRKAANEIGLLYYQNDRYP